MFLLPFIQGDPNTALSQPILSHLDTAKKFFKIENPTYDHPVDDEDGILNSARSRVF